MQNQRVFKTVLVLIFSCGTLPLQGTADGMWSITTWMKPIYYIFQFTVLGVCMQSSLLINIALQLAGKWERCEVVLQELQHSGKVIFILQQRTPTPHCMSIHLFFSAMPYWFHSCNVFHWLCYQICTALISWHHSQILNCVIVLPSVKALCLLSTILREGHLLTKTERVTDF